MKPLCRQFDIIACDLTGPFSPSIFKGNPYILACICLRKKFSIAIPIPDKSVEIVIQAYLQHVYATFKDSITFIIGICHPSRQSAHIDACGCGPSDWHCSCTASCTPRRGNCLSNMLLCFYFSPIWTFIISSSHRVGCHHAVSASRAGILMQSAPSASILKSVILH